MADHLYLHVNPVTGIYRVVIEVPSHLIPFLPHRHAGLKNLTKSTTSRDLAEAKEIAEPIIEYYLAVLKEAENLSETSKIIRQGQIDAGEDDPGPTLAGFDKLYGEGYKRPPLQYLWGKHYHAFRLIPKRRRRSKPTSPG